MLKRKAYEKLLTWKKDSAGSTALLIEGARRVGKTRLVEEFGKREYRSMLFIDFAKANESVKQYFRDMPEDLDSLFLYLSARYGVTLHERQTLVVFDEVQRFPFARQLVKYLVEDGRYDYIETGSLISIRENADDIVIPSEEVTFELDPLDFDEFLWALGEEPLSALLARARTKLEPLPDDLHRKATRLFREYMLVGGMPAVVSEYASHRSFAKVDDLKRSILSLYRRDITRFAKGYEYKVVAVFDQIPGQLSKHEKKFTLSSLPGEARRRTYESAFFWLDDARIVNPCYRISDPSIDLRMTRDDSAVKCYMGDTGLLFSHAFPKGTLSEKTYQDVLLGKIGVNEGMLVENAVAQALRCRGEDLLFYSSYDREDAGRRMEVDFLIAREYPNADMKIRVSPVEVKSSGRYSTIPLDKFKRLYGANVGTQFVLHPKPLKVEGDRVFLPLYMMHLL